MNWSYVYFGLYFILFVLGTVGLGFWQIKKRRERPPVEFKLLRGPGESLRKRMAAFDENVGLHLVGWALFPLVTTTTAGAIWIAIRPPSTGPAFYAWLVTLIVVFGASVTLSGNRVLKGLMRYRCDRLGYLGERFVGEKLAALERKSFYVFHDVPAEAGERKFNLDHVVVGPTGLWLIETKTRRKGRTREGFKDHEVVFDGTQLIWPWGEDRHGLEQAESEARWLTEWIHKRTGFDVTAKPILTLPGWMVKERKVAPIRVLNPINIPSAILGRGQQVLGVEQIDIIARQLEDRCRDVED